MDGWLVDGRVSHLMAVVTHQMLVLIQKLLSSDSFDDAVAMATLLQTLSVMTSTLGSVSCSLCLSVCLSQYTYHQSDM